MQCHYLCFFKENEKKMYQNENLRILKKKNQYKIMKQLVILKSDQRQLLTIYGKTEYTF